MKRFKRKGTIKIDELSLEHFTFRQSTLHGFPSGPSALCFDPETLLLAIGTKSGELRIYGRPGMELRAQTETKLPITHIFFFGNLHQLITVSINNQVLLWELEREGQLCLRVTKDFQLDPDGGKKITTCCLSKLSGLFFIGTEGGNIFTMDVKHFVLRNDEVIFWNNATALIQLATKTQPGKVCSIKLCPTNPNKLLIGYEKGIIVLWDVAQSVPERNFPAGIQDCQKPLESLSWQNDGMKFVSSHSDASVYFWSASSSSPSEGPTKHYGDTCNAITQISWLNTDSNPLLVFMGGLPSAEADEHNTVTVFQGTEHTALDFGSRVIDFATLNDPTTQRGKALVVLCEQEILAFDLEMPKCPQIRNPYLYSIDSSPVTCIKVYDNCPKQLLTCLKEVSPTGPSPREQFSNAEWPAMGGFVRDSEAPSFDVLLTGHEDGSVKFWDVTSPAMTLLHELKTAIIFSNLDSDAVESVGMFSEFSWPPYRKVGAFDLFDDDERLAIRQIDFCPYSQKLCIGGAAGQVLTFAFNPNASDVKVQHEEAVIFESVTSHIRRGRKEGLQKDTSPLECKNDFISFPAGFQPSFCVQCLPPMPITALAFRPSWGLVAAGIAKGFMVGNFYIKNIVVVHTTVRTDGLEVRNIGRVQNLRRSLRSSLRRRSTSVVADDRSQVAATLNLEIGVHEKRRMPGGDRRKVKSDAMAVSPPPLGSPIPMDGIRGDRVSPEYMGSVCSLTFAETHIAAHGPHVAILASTMGSSIVRYSIEVPEAENKYTLPNRAFPIGKDYALVHAAPIVTTFVLDHDGLPLPSPSEVDMGLVSSPNMDSPHFCVIVTQEQIKVITLPGAKSKRKEKVLDLMHQRVMKAWLIKVKVPAAPVGAIRDWNNALAVLSTTGNVLVYSIPDLRLTFHKPEFLPQSDQKALHSMIFSQTGETFHLRSFSEIERRLLCSYNFSYHTCLLPSLHRFEGSTAPVQVSQGVTRGSLRQRELVVSAEISAEGPVAQGHRKSSARESKVKSSSPERKEEEEVRTDEPKKVPSSTDLETEAALRHSVRSSSVPRSATSPSNSVVSTSENEMNRQSGAEADHSDTPDGGKPANTIDSLNISSKDRQAMINAAAFTETVRQRAKSPASSSSSSSSSNSSESEDDDSDDLCEAGTTFCNPQVVDDGAEDGKDTLDTIIASSLQQLENARSFYERMQQQTRAKQTSK